MASVANRGDIERHFETDRRKAKENEQSERESGVARITLTYAAANWQRPGTRRDFEQGQSQTKGTLKTIPERGQPNCDPGPRRQISDARQRHWGSTGQDGR